MIFTETILRGAYLLDLEKRSDDRGFFARTFCEEEFRARGLKAGVVQCAAPFNVRKGTLRGMHYQAAPHAQAKLVRCTRGAVFDVLLDLRPESPMFKKWVSVELTAESGRMVYVPEGFAHGFQSLEDESEVFYQMAAPHRPESERGVRWDDPAFGIEWPPAPERILSSRDRAFPDFAG